jgi:hypothetical protein
VSRKRHHSPFSNNDPKFYTINSRLVWAILPYTTGGRYLRYTLMQICWYSTQPPHYWTEYDSWSCNNSSATNIASCCWTPVYGCEVRHPVKRGSVPRVTDGIVRRTVVEYVPVRLPRRVCVICGINVVACRSARVVYCRFLGRLYFSCLCVMDTGI